MKRWPLKSRARIENKNEKLTKWIICACVFQWLAVKPVKHVHFGNRWIFSCWVHFIVSSLRFGCRKHRILHHMECNDLHRIQFQIARISKGKKMLKDSLFRSTSVCVQMENRTIHWMCYFVYLCEIGCVRIAHGKYKHGECWEL